MSNGLMYAQMGMAAVSAYSQYSAAKHDAKMREIQQKYHNKMVAISRVNELNNLTENEIATTDAFKRAQVAMASSALQDKANAELSAAVAGVRGGSVEATQRGLARSKLTADWTLQRKRKSQIMAESQQWMSVNVDALRARDTAIIPKPSVSAAVTGLATTLLDIYDTNQPESQQISSHLSRLGS